MHIATTICIVNYIEIHAIPSNFTNLVILTIYIFAVYTHSPVIASVTPL